MNTLIDGLTVFLSSNFVLYTNTHVAHWNIVGSLFFELHKMLEDQYNDLWEQVDVIAEKIRMQDEFVSLTLEDQSKLSLIEPLKIQNNANEYLQKLFNDHQRMIILLNKIFKLATNEDNQAIANYIAERLDAHAKARWFLKSSLTKLAN